MTQQEARAALAERWLFEEENGKVAVRDAELIRISQSLRASKVEASLRRAPPQPLHLTPPAS